jgi:hypothetical protein
MRSGWTRWASASRRRCSPGSAYPELVQRWLEGTVIANQHKVAARLVASMRTALGTALAPTLTGTPVTWST